MSQEKVRQHNRAADAFSDHDLEAFLAISHPEIEQLPYRGGGS